ncbi:prolyl oligopeptidase family serine peptidase [Solihabitans fulvus]|uniref:Prolyl oligopeptidase family serine peptidase n=1 Tax=Solihabitans fulvus TaxID=1892852 RepID=A0A5B2WPD6_9PSEU|nr:DPP IV N-terminal domain-containing protein [Solihabitans fulvus]KAA2253621.1 prolyl oligopeptidase family serine peptidase [Solihabitans fulvus]
METTRLDASAYRSAEQLLRHNRSKLVFGDKVRPQWIDGGVRFWYSLRTAAGRQFVLVDPAAGTREPAFDHGRLASALASAAGQQVDAAKLPFEAIEFTGGAVEFDAFESSWRCDLDTYVCERADAGPPGSFLDITSPDGKHAVYLNGHDLWVRSVEDGAERALTSDGEADRQYGASPFTPDVLLAKIGLPYLPPAVTWSPDSTRVLTHLTDQRAVRQTHLVEAMPADGGEPRLVTQRYAFPGDEHVPLGEFVVLDVATGAAVRANTEPLLMPLMSPITTGWAWWAEDGSAVHYLRQSRDVRTLSLHRLDPATGEVTTLLTESGATRVEPAQQQTQQPMVRVLSGGREVLWYSQRDGWGHLYLVDLRSELHAQVTSGRWAVQEILHVDEAAGVVYFVASGLVEADPYRRSVCRVGLDGSGFARITDDDLDHVVTVAENAEYFIDSASTSQTPPVISVRDWTGRVAVELERADITGLVATGWSPPEPFRVKAADGETDIHGVLYLPHGFDPRRSYPVIDHPYPGPHIRRGSSAFDPGILGHDAEAAAALGFVVVAVDGRGTPGRDKAFHDASYGRLQDGGGLVDHVAALRQLAESRPWMDLDRVGIFGLSGGGFATVRAMGTFPEFYKVGVAEAGNHDNRFYHLWWAETYDGPASENDYLRTSNVELADRIEGKLLLIHGGMDDNVHPHLTLRLVDRLIAADKDFDLLIVPGAEHAFFGYEHYVSRRRWDFLVRNLLGIEPPEGYRLTPAPIDMEIIAELFG